MQYRFDTKVEEMETEVNDLSKLIREEMRRVDDRFDGMELSIGKIREETRDKLFNLQTA